MLKRTEEDAFGDDFDPGFGANAAIEANLVANLATELYAPFLSDSPRRPVPPRGGAATRPPTGRRPDPRRELPAARESFCRRRWGLATLSQAKFVRPR